MKQSNQIEMSLILKDFEKGNKISAYNSIIKYLIIYPNDESALYNSAYMSEKIGYIDEAIIKYNKIIKKNSNHWRAINNLYLIYFHQQRYSESLILVDSVLKIKPKYQPALRDKAHILYHLKKLDTALQIIIDSLKLNPNDYIALNVMGMIYSGMGSEEMAIKIYNQAILIKKNYYPTYNNLAKCLNILKRVDEAEKNLKYCLNLKPDFDEAINNLGNVYTVCGKYTKAISLYLKILKKNKNHQHANLNIAISYFFLGNETKAEKHFLIAKKINPNDDRFQKNYSLFLLFQQKYKQAWKIADGRLKLNDFILTGTYIDNIKDKIWIGDSPINFSEKILIVKEQGIGDEILHSTIYPDLIKKFPNCKIETEDRLLSIFKRSYETNNQIIKDKSISGDKYKIKNIDKIIFAQSLGRLFRNTINDFPEKNSIVPKQDLVTKISSKLNNISNNKKIGIAWKSKRFFFGKGKSLNISEFELIFKLKNIDFVNLQYDETHESIINLNKEKNLNIISLPEIDLFNDFEGTAALLSSLDLFITVSNSTAHLAGALNIPTWLIKPEKYAIFHYWNQKSNRTPWYSSIKLFEKKSNNLILMTNLRKELEKKFNL